MRNKIVIMLSMLVMGAWITCMNSQDTEAATKSESSMIVEEGVTVAMVRSTTSSSIVAAATDSTRKVKGDGVRLRKKPSSTAVILESMYSGEIVEVYDDSGKTWWKVKRKKTGTIGYVNRNYLTW